MKFKRYISILAAVFIIFSNCIVKAASINLGENDQLKDMEMISENNKIALYMNKETTEIAVQDKESNKIWYSNPQNRDSESIASGSKKLELSSQLYIEYFNNATLQLSSMDNYFDSIRYGQFKIQNIKDGVKVIYIIGKVEKGKEAIPQLIAKERFESLILSKVSEEEKKELLRRYKLISINKDDLSEETKKDMKSKYFQIESTDLYELNKYTPDFEIPKLIDIIAQSGYSQDDLNKDNMDNKIVTTVKQNANFEIPIEYKIEEDNLVAKVPCDEVKYNKEFPLYSIRLLQYFGAEDATKDGYMFVPDGSGALIYLNNNKTNVERFYMPLYGQDNSIKEEERNQFVEQGCLPVYGLKAEGKAFLAIIEKGDSHAAITADVSGRLNSYNYIGSEFIIRPKDKVVLDNGKGKSNIDVFQSENYKGDIQVRYCFLSNESANYSGMAKSYQDYLVKNGVLKKKINDHNVPFYLNAVGAIQKKKSIFGIPLNISEALTTYDQTKTILDDLQSNGIENIKLIYTGWFNKGVNHTLPNDINLIRRLGGKSDFKSLVNYLKERDIGFYPDVAFQNVYGNGLWFSPKRDAVRYTFKEVVLRYRYNLSDNIWNYDKGYHFLLSPLGFSGVINKFMKDFSKLSINGLFLRDLGNELNSDFNTDKLVDRQHSEEIIKEQFKMIQGKGISTAINTGNVYALPYADFILNIPMDSSHYFIEDETVPFYQMVIHSYVSYVGDSINLAQNYRKSLLKTIETGAGIYYTGIFDDNSKVKDTEYDYLYSVNYKDWIEEAADFYKKVNNDMGDLQDKKIIDHKKVMEDVYQTYFENGKSVIVNYSDEKKIINGIALDEMSYKVLEGDGAL